MRLVMDDRGRERFERECQRADARHAVPGLRDDRITEARLFVYSRIGGPRLPGRVPSVLGDDEPLRPDVPTGFITFDLDDAVRVDGQPDQPELSSGGKGDPAAICRDPGLFRHDPTDVMTRYDPVAFNPAGAPGLAASAQRPEMNRSTNIHKDELPRIRPACLAGYPTSMTHSDVMNDINSVNTGPTPGGRRASLLELARRWNVSPMYVWQAAQELHLPAVKMASTISAANEQRLFDQVHRQTRLTRALAAVSPGMLITSSKRGTDKSAYLAATTPTKERLARAEAAEKADLDLCTCCEVPLPRNQYQSATVCMECGNQGHRSINGPDRELILARMHTERFRTDYLRQLDRTAEANEDRRAANRRANNWAGTLTRMMVDHDATGRRCTACKGQPCAVWPKLERLNRPLAIKIQNDYYSLSPAQLDEKLNDGIISDDGEDG